jgi:hypothetical protein
MEGTDMDTASTRITTRAEFGAALRHVLDEAISGGTRELFLVDRDFDAWPLDEEDVLERLTQWARLPGRHATLYAHNFETLPRRLPRFTQWRRTWSHALECRSLEEVDASEVPTLLLAGDGLGLQLLDKRYCRGRWFRDDTTWRTWREVVDALSQRSETAFGSTTLGL